MQSCPESSTDRLTPHLLYTAGRLKNAHVTCNFCRSSDVTRMRSKIVRKAEPLSELESQKKKKVDNT